MASFACLAPVTYLGGRAGSSKPRWLGLGVLLMGTGSLLFALPHFLVPNYRIAGNEAADVCTPNRTVRYIDLVTIKDLRYNILNTFRD